MTLPKTSAATTSAIKGHASMWPGAFSVYKYSREVVKHNLLLLASLWGAYFIIDILLSTASRPHYSLLGILINFIIATVFTVMITQVLLAGLHERQISFSNIFSSDLPNLTAKLLVLEILTGISVVVSFLLFIIPAFFVIPRLVLAPYFLIDKNMGPVEALVASWNATKGNALKVWGILGVTILMALLMITIIGIPVAIYLLFMYSGAIAALYAFLLNNDVTSAQTLPKQG